VGSRRLALANASKTLAFVRAIARAKPKAARRKAAGKPDGWGDGVKIESYAACFSAHFRTWFAIDSHSKQILEFSEKRFSKDPTQRPEKGLSFLK